MDTAKKESFIQRLTAKSIAWWNYCSKGVWADRRRSPAVRLVKILNLSVNAFFDRGLQIKSMALTYSTVLSIVPAFALLLAIGRGFGLQDMIQNELYLLFPSQHQVLNASLKFVDSYLKSASEGLFVGVGIIMLLWTIISLLSSIEDAFNSIWDVKQARSFFRKVTDYITICLMVPVLLICSSGLSIFMSTTVQDIFFFSFLTPVVNFVLELAPLFLSWLAFTISYWLIPNTKVDFKFAAITGTVAAIGFYIVQWLFINGQVYVSKYNAIYGSFAFLPLLLIWLQLSWLILLAGCVLTYSMQNIFTFNFLGNENELSAKARRRVAVIVMAIITQRFANGDKALTRSELAAGYNLPIRLVGSLVDTFKSSGLLDYIDNEGGEFRIAPARDISGMTVAELLHVYDNAGIVNPNPEFDTLYAPAIKLFNPVMKSAYKIYSTLRLADLPIPTRAEVRKSMEA